MAGIARRASQRHAQQQAVGEWHEGVIVFPSGDVVVRFIGSFWGSTDTTIEAVYLSRADVVRACSPWRCLAPRNHLVIRFLGIDARPAVLSICEIELRDDVAQAREGGRAGGGAGPGARVSLLLLRPPTAAGRAAHQRAKGLGEGLAGLLTRLCVASCRDARGR